MALADLIIRNAKLAEKQQKLADERGLHLIVAPSGGKWWRLKYRLGGKENSLSLGTFPDVSLKEARERRDAARKLLSNGVDPAVDRKVQKATATERAANSFEVVAREWFAKLKPSWAPSHADKIIARLERDIFPWIGGRPIAELKAPELLAVVRRIEERGALETAHRALQNCGQVFRYAVATGRAERDPSADLRGALPPTQPTHYVSLTDPGQVADMLRAFDAFQGTFIVQCALRLAPLWFVRPGELRKARWTDFDLDRAEWRYHVTKTKTEHLVPLARQAVTTLRALYALTGNRDYVFPGRDPKKPMSEAAINAALRRMGFDTKTEITGHGFRAMARTILHEQLRFPADVIEHQLAHKVPDALGTAYNRTKFVDDRRAMMQAWADYLDALKARADVVPLFRQAQ